MPDGLARPEDRDYHLEEGVIELPEIEKLQKLKAMRDELGEDGLSVEELGFLEQFEPRKKESSKFGDNIAEYLDDEVLGRIAHDVIERFDWDHQARMPWYEREVKGIRLLGVTDKTDGGAKFKGASKVVHPLLAEACVQFQARTMSEMWPAGGPVRTIVVGDSTDEQEQQAQRVSSYMNYKLNNVMPGAYDAEDKSKIRLPLSGSVFKKVYTDPVYGEMDDYVAPDDFIVPYNAECLRTAPRYTHVIYQYPNEVKRLQNLGYYRDVDLQAPDESSAIERPFYAEIKDAEGTIIWSHEDHTERHTNLEMHTDWNIPGFEDKDENGKETGLELPYVITVDYDNQQVLSIYRNWKEEDPKKLKRIWFTHDKFIPGYGFYGWGFSHWIGGLCKAATGALRALLDAAQFSNAPGGYRSKLVKGLQNNVSPGEYVETEFDPEDLQNAFYDLPYKEPSAVLFNLLGYIQDVANRFASTTDTMVGEGSTSVPVGTTLARVEQGEKVYSAIHSRLHRSKREEFKLLAEQIKLNLKPGEGYPFAFEGVSQEIIHEDFDDRVDIVPVSDPAVVSTTQRMMQGQLILDMAERAPNLYDMRAVHKRALGAARVNNIEELIPDHGQSVKIDPVQENMSLATNKPIQAYPDQDHLAHQLVHQYWFATLPPEQQEQYAAPYNAHIAEHEAWKHYAEMTGAMGVELPADVMTGEGQELSADDELAISLSAAKAVQLLQQQQPDPEAEEAVVEMEAEAQKAQLETEAFLNEEERKDEAHAAEIERKNQATIAEIERKNAAAETDLANKVAAEEKRLEGKE
jgi:hypothetical protein